MGHKECILSSRWIGPARAWTQILIYFIWAGLSVCLLYIIVVTVSDSLSCCPIQLYIQLLQQPLFSQYPSFIISAKGDRFFFSCSPVVPGIPAGGQVTSAALDRTNLFSFFWRPAVFASKKFNDMYFNIPCFRPVFMSLLFNNAVCVFLMVLNNDDFICSTLMNVSH